MCTTTYRAALTALRTDTLDLLDLPVVGVSEDAPRRLT